MENVKQFLLACCGILLLVGCGKHLHDMVGTRVSGNAVQSVDSQPMHDQRTVFANLKDDILVLECTDVDFNTCPIAIGDRRFTIAQGWGYKNGRLTHVIQGAGLTEGVLILDCPDRQDSDAIGDMTEEWNAVQQNLFCKDSTVHFMNKGYQIERVNGDSVFAQPVGRRPETVGEMWVFVGKIPDYRHICHLETDLAAIDSCQEHNDKRLLRIAALCHRWSSGCYQINDETCTTAENMSYLVVEEYAAQPDGFLAYVAQQGDQTLLNALIGAGERFGDPTLKTVRAQAKRLKEKDLRAHILKMLAE